MFFALDQLFLNVCHFILHKRTFIMVSLFLLHHFGFRVDSVTTNKMNYDMRKRGYIMILPEELPVSVRGILIYCCRSCYVTCRL